MRCQSEFWSDFKALRNQQGRRWFNPFPQCNGKRSTALLPTDPFARELLAAAIVFLMILGLLGSAWLWRRNKRRDEKIVSYRFGAQKKKR